MSRGYAASKWVGEKLCFLARERGLPCNIFRLGLVWGDTARGRYDPAQHYYRVIKSSLLAGYGIKNYMHDVPPTPVDFVARSIAVLASRHRTGGGVFHISSSETLDKGIFECCNELLETFIDLTSFGDWVAMMKRLGAEGKSLPVVPLIEFYENPDRSRWSSVVFNCSRTLHELEREGITAPPVNEDAIRRCVEDMLTRDADVRELAVLDRRRQGVLRSMRSQDRQVHDG